MNRDLKKAGVVFTASLAAGFYAQYMRGEPLGLVAVAGAAIVFFVPGFLLSFMYRGWVGLIPGLGIISLLILLLFSNMD